MPLHIEIRKPSDEDNANAIFVSLFLAARNNYQTILAGYVAARFHFDQPMAEAPPESKREWANHSFDFVIDKLAEGSPYRSALAAMRDAFVSEIEGDAEPPVPTLKLVR